MLNIRHLILFAIAIVACPLAANAQYKAHSVLASGSWCKIGIRETGIYRIGAGDVASIVGCATASVAVYAQRGGALSSENGEWRPDDLAELPVEIVDANSNGLFDGNDYLLLFATGPDKWSYSNDYARWTYNVHSYSALSYVYLTSREGTHRRLEQATGGNTSASASTCRSTTRHEVDQTNTHKSGQLWVGERFYGGNMEQTFTLTLPAVPTGNIKVKYALASVSTAASSFRITLNGETRNAEFNKRTRYRTVYEEFPSAGSTTLSFKVTYSCNESMATGYLDYIEVDAETPATLAGNYNELRMEPGNGTMAKYTVGGAGSQTRVWDVTDMDSVKEMQTSVEGGQFAFVGKNDRRRTYAVFNAGAYKSPQSFETIGNQDIHGAAIPELVIVCHRSLRAQAERLASLHSINDNIETLVVTEEEVYNEFSSGQRDPMAIREMLRMFRARAISANEESMPRHLLLLGKGTYDNKNLMGSDIATVVTYQTWSSFDDDGVSIATDDILTYLDDGEGLSSGATMDVSVGRLPAKNADEAKHLVDKIESYMMRSDLLNDDIRGDWRNCVALLADDADPSCGGDTNFTSSSEYIWQRIRAQYPQFTVDKIYADAYVQQSGADGSYYPDVNNALKKRLDYGCLLLNYIGHGSSQYIGTERYMMKSDIAAYANYNQLPFFITSTCTFGRYDDPQETCGAEEFLLANGGGIACLAASRPISHIKEVNATMVLEALNPNNTIGDAIRNAKNTKASAQALTLIGDPALRLSHPRHEVVVTAINENIVDSSKNDTALVLSTVTVEGEIRDASGAVVDDFDGYLFSEVYDRPKQTQTLANDNDGYEVTIMLQNSLLYRGRTPVSNGRFSYRFIVPRDVSYVFGRSRLSHYAKSVSDDATGAYGNLWLGGFDESVAISETRPEIRLFMNDTSFRNGGITDANPTLLALLYDEKGINAVGSGLGHDITAVLDDNPNNILTLNDFYETDINDEHYGQIRYNLTGLSSGRHTIKLKVWNIFNYSNSSEIVFYVHGADTATTRFAAAPNPASDHVLLWLEHNNRGKMANAQLEIFDMQGQSIRQWEVPVTADGFVVGPTDWDLNSYGGTRVTPGVYIARFIVTDADGEKFTSHGKIIVK